MKLEVKASAAVTSVDVTREEYLESRSRSFNRTWSIAEDYIAKEGCILPICKGEVISPELTLKEDNHYLPMGRPELPGEFARLADESEEKVLDFVRRYGLLGYYRRPEQSRPINPINDFSGDPLNWIFVHAKTVNLAMNLAEALDKPKELKILTERFFVKEALSWRGKEWNTALLLPKPALDLPGYVGTIMRASARENALSVIESILNPNLTGLTRKMQVEWSEEKGEQVINTFFSFGNLLDCIYWLLADAVTNAKIRSCEHCGKPFVAPNDRTKYCPPLQWETVSRCMNRAKQARHRDKRRREGAKQV